MIDKFIFAASGFHVLMASRKSFLFLTAIGLTEQGNVLNLAHTDMHTDHKAGRGDHYHNGKDNS
jgi:hypothetical protein